MSEQDKKKNQDKKRFDKGAETMKKVYAGMVQSGEHGTDRFMDLMVPSIFGELWNEGLLSIPQRRLFVMGIIAAQGEYDTLEIQCMAALLNGELSEDELREIASQGAPYAGYPRAGGMRGAVERAIATVKGGGDIKVN
jgi:4-carboxymuconolactone decarboxylase